MRAVNVLRLGRASLPFLFILPPLLADAPTRTTIVIWELAFVVLAITAWFRLRVFVGGPRFPRDRAIYRRVTKYGLTISGFRIVEVLNERNGLILLAAFFDQRRGRRLLDRRRGDRGPAAGDRGARAEHVQPHQLRLARGVGGAEHPDDAPLRAARRGGERRRHPAGYVVLPWVLGPGYDEVPLLLLLLPPNVLCLAAVRPLYSFFQVQTEKPVSMFRVAGGAGGNTALNVALVPALGAKGAAIAASTSGIVAVIVAFRAFAADAHARFATFGRGASSSGTTSSWWRPSPDAGHGDGGPGRASASAS